MGKIDLKDKRVLVTGGNGYLGRHLVAQLKKEQANVFVIDKFGDAGELGSNIFLFDLTDKEIVETMLDLIQPDIIFHLAASLNRARNFDDYQNIHNVNLNGTIHLLNALKNRDYEHFIFASTSEIYGDNVPPFNENKIPAPTSPYSLTKLFAENFIQTFSKTYRKKFTILRIFNFFGKQMSPQFFIPQMINTLTENKPFEMTKGEQKRDFLYVNDVINGLILTAKHEANNEIYNLCSGQAVSLKELVLKVKSTLNSQSDIVFGALPYRENEVWNMVGDNAKIRKDLGFVPMYDLGAGIEEVISNKVKS